MPPDATPDLSEDPVREPGLTAALSAIDATHAVDSAALARMEQRLSAALRLPRTAIGTAPVSTRPLPDPDGQTATAAVSVSLGLVLCIQRAQRWIPLSAAAAAAAVLVALSMTPRMAPSGPSTLVAYVGGRAGAAVVADAALGLNASPAELLGGAGKP